MAILLPFPEYFRFCSTYRPHNTYLGNYHILIALPDKIDLDDSEYNLTKKTNNLIENIFRTESFISPYYSENTENN